MQYRLVYDVLNDGSPWAVFRSFAMLIAGTALLLAVYTFLEILERVQGRPPVRQPTPRGIATIEDAPLPFVIVSFLILLAAGVFMACRVCEAFVDQKRFQEWVKTGAFQVTEGTVADYQHSRVGPRFRVGDLAFDCLDKDAGFHGRFNAPGAARSGLRDGLGVRLAHRQGIILRLEIRSE